MHSHLSFCQVETEAPVTSSTVTTMTSSVAAPSISNALGTTHTTQGITQMAPNTQALKVRPNCRDNHSVCRPSFALQRKLDDALQTLDDAVFVPSETLERPSPPKKSRSIYSTLAKYGITFKEPKSLVHPTCPVSHSARTRSTQLLLAFFTQACPL